MADPDDSAVEQKLDATEHPLLKLHVVDHFLQYLSLPIFGLSAIVCRQWHFVTLTGKKATGVWERGVRSGELGDNGRHAPFWSSMCDMRNCVSDPTAGTLVDCLRSDLRSDLDHGGKNISVVSLFDATAGGPLSFDERDGVFLRLQGWAAAAAAEAGSAPGGARADSWEARLAGSVASAIARCQERHHLLGTSSSTRRLFSRVERVARTHVGFTVARRGTGGGDGDLRRLTAASIRRCAEGASEEEVVSWLQKGAQAVGILIVLLWESRTKDELLSSMEDEDAFWTLGSLSECPWYDLQTFSTSLASDDHPRMHQLRQLLDAHCPNVLVSVSFLIVDVFLFIALLTFG